ncbi:lytic transglycosylase domain-containing protein [Plesiomonas sp.]|uniref:lytic transglycosylase domain-containing protein n=1 Tax=Plesiomonas sp. TaxID=2486279 RepID=UPI003F3B6774
MFDAIYTEQSVPAAEMQYCIAKASQLYSVPGILLKAISQVEGGKKWTISKNSNGSYDLGPMQINTIHLPRLQAQFPGLTWQALASNTCLNVAVAGSLLQEHLYQCQGDVWCAVGNYHSKTPQYHINYRTKVVNAYLSLLVAKQNKAQATKKTAIRNTAKQS